MKNSLFIIVLTFLTFKSFSQAVVPKNSFCVVNIELDSTNTKNLKVTIHSKIALNYYPFVSKVTDCKGTIIAIAESGDYFGQQASSYQTYDLIISNPIIFNPNFKYFVYFNTGIDVKYENGKVIRIIKKLTYVRKKIKCKVSK